MLLDVKIESILFFRGEAVSLSELSKILEEHEDKIKEAIILLKEKLRDRGIVLVKNDNKVMLGTNPEMYKIIESLKKEELSKDLGKASLETLSIILYRSPIRKSEIDYIRGVNSATILRNLLVRGLVERKTDTKNQKSFLYYPTIDLITFLGISDLDELPEYKKVREEIKIEKSISTEIPIDNEKVNLE